MYSLSLKCTREDMDLLSCDLWEAGTEGIRETEFEDGLIELVASFSTNDHTRELLLKFARFRPNWCQEPEVDWEQESRNAWPGRPIGKTLFLTPPWDLRPAPQGRRRIIHNPGLACGTGEHPCTQMALLALEQNIVKGSSVVDVGTGSGVLAIASLKLGARFVLGLDVDETALSAARENFASNELKENLVAGSADCVTAEWADVVVANISATVLLALADDLLRVLKPDGQLILTGFPVSELPVIKDVFRARELLEQDGWCCVTSTLSSAASQ